ncbi:hypothetical protein MM_0555 [Methanosarcina mazei Go1]|uniref:Uncharacterized protein n=1 Tax=Methanosarcina mazei (strain ATCC BAA-159 / DSM 3647 / Goe1 / Go1 / JCM 11833 / OCM 88) TaxID=192952 RepID=Q8PZD9_METMA|nr:hypothetical protein MM_0555 [Methanosarcina mazei Go1]
MVSILVLMDLAREFSQILAGKDKAISFNPCFNGSCSRICMCTHGVHIRRSFNPCFNGSCSRIGKCYINERTRRKFQSLF